MATIESVDFYYLAMPQITLDVDGSQDALLVRVTSGGIEGWGECEAAPLVSIASFVCPPLTAPANLLGTRYWARN